MALQFVNQAKVLLIHDHPQKKKPHEVNGWVITLKIISLLQKFTESLTSEHKLDKYDVIITEGEISQTKSLV